MAYTPLQLAEAFIKAGELVDALDALNEQLSAHPDDDASRRLRAQVLLRLGEPEQLQQAADDLNAVQAQTPADLYLLSVISERTNGDHALEKALTYAQQAYEKTDDPREKSRILERGLNLMRKAGQLKEALALALEHDLIQWAADAAADLNDDEAALVYYGQAIERIKTLWSEHKTPLLLNIAGNMYLKRAAIYQRMHNFWRAKIEYHYASGIIKDDPMIEFNRGLMAAKQDAKDSSAHKVKKALKDAPLTLQKIMYETVQADPDYHHLLRLFDDKFK